MEKNSTHGKVKELRKTKVDFISELAFKKVMFGGYNCKEVEDYIHTLKNNMELSESAFNEKLEEYSSASAMYAQERDKLLQSLKEAEKEIEQLREEAQINKEEAQVIRDDTQIISEGTQVIIEREKTSAAQAQKENEDLKSLVESLKQQISNDEKSKKVSQEIEEVKRENKGLVAQVNKLMENKEKLIMENATWLKELDKTTINVEKLNIENEELKRTINALRVSKRNNAMNSNMSVFEYKQNHQLNVEIISNNINELTKAVNAMKTDMYDLMEKTKIDLNEED